MNMAAGRLVFGIASGEPASSHFDAGRGSINDRALLRAINVASLRAVENLAG